MSTNLTILNSHHTTIEIKNSTFIAYLKYVESEQEAKYFIEKIKQQHPDANHNCSAYIIGQHQTIQKANDDGEPSGTAGVPMLEVLKKQNLHNICVVVTRYFGGIKLGGGGLIRAYSKSTSEVINDSTIVAMKPSKHVQLTLNYDQTQKFEHAIKDTDYLLQDTTYTENVTYDLAILESDYDDFLDWLNQMTQSNYDLIEKETTLKGFPV
ncbi:YigZ family protein [Abyssicoccus albus]|uniref:Putative YigZ family protein n=1 Tax=Abyssicoccus albus TaxID=1817405 RepID=A0A3N5BR40_9BACL|nr:YigZ family protein [Abyssicoccus albus]RPF57470.1 putative YigZ family protein [Abyssicoccus albus]